MSLRVLVVTFALVLGMSCGSSTPNKAAAAEVTRDPQLLSNGAYFEAKAFNVALLRARSNGVSHLNLSPEYWRPL